MLADIATHTNKKIQSVIIEISITDNAIIPTHIKMTNCIAIKSLFGLFYARGLLGQKKREVKSNYSWKGLVTQYLEQ